MHKKISICICLSLIVSMAISNVSATVSPQSSPASSQPFEMIGLSSANKNVLMLQQRLIDLDYFSFKTTGSYGSMTKAAVIRFQELNAIGADGVVGEQTFNLIFSNKAVRCSIPANVHMPIGQTSSSPSAEFGADEDWAEVIDPIFLKDVSYTVTDIYTGTTFQIVRTGGVNHARVETANVLDTQAFITLFGGEFNWSKRPVTVTIDAKKYAASLQGMPSGDDGRDGNEMMGGCALYFSNSKSDIANVIDEEHRINVLKASGNWN